MSKILDKKELHLTIIWQNGRNQEKKILEYIFNNFELVEKYKVNWNKDLFRKNLSCFYGANLTNVSHKEEHCGNGEFVLITFYDNKPKYGIVETSRGSETVNLNLFNIKEKFRNWTGGGHKIHTTNSVKETNHDLTLLLGLNYNDYEKSIIVKNYKAEENINKILNHSKNIVGVGGWDSLEQLFYVMNATTEYVVLRNFENLPAKYNSDEHGDIDFLVKDLSEIIFITSAEKVFDEEDRVYFKIKIAGTDVFVDFRYVGDNYYDETWQRNILKNKELTQRGFFVPTNEDYFYSLIYHCLFHKFNIASDYPHKIKNIYSKLEIYNEKNCYFSNYFLLLEKFLSDNSYQVIKPKDQSVFFDERFLKYKKELHNLKTLNLKKVKPFLVHEWKYSYYYIYFLAENDDGKKIFIKSGGISDSTRREFKVIEELRKINTKFFPQNYAYRYTPSVSFFSTYKIDGERLDNLILSGELFSKSDDFKKNLFKGIFAILEILHDAKIVHRDIRPGNLIIQEDGSPILIDFVFAVDVKRKRYREYDIFKKKPRKLHSLGKEFAKNNYHWDDAYSVFKIFEELNFKNDSEFMQIKEKIFKMIGRNEIISVKNNFFAKKFVLMRNFFHSSKNSTTRINPKYKIWFYKILCLITFNKRYREKINKHSKYDN